jgi:cholesterol transport system auxiliary component
MSANPDWVLCFRRGVAALTLVFSLTALLAGCGGLQLKPPPMAVYDLGLGPGPQAGLAFEPVSIEIRTPPWLDTSMMQYRLQWSAPERRRSYAESRWVAQPADMLGLALGRGLKSGATVALCRLQIELDEFIHVFDTPERSRVEVVVRAALVPPRTEAPIAAREFRVVRSASGDDAVGGVMAYRQAADELIRALADWMSALDPASGAGLNTESRCGG